MRFALALFKYFPFGGLQRDFRAVANECITRGHQVDIYVHTWQGDRLPGAQIHVLPVKGFFNHQRDWNFTQTLGEIAAQQHYDAIVGFNTMPHLDVHYAAGACYLRKAALNRRPLHWITTRHRNHSRQETAIFSPESKTTILALCEQQIADFRSYYNTPLERFHILPPWLNADRFPPPHVAQIRQDLRAQFNISDDEKWVLLVGSGFKLKGVDRALLAVAALPETLRQKTKFFVIGQDNPKRYLHQAATLGIKDQVRFLGGRSDVPHFMFAADLLLHPSYLENTGNVIIEALVAGLPVLTTDACGFAPFVSQHQAGQVISAPFQQTALNVALAELLTHPEPQQLRDRALAFAQQHDFTAMPKLATDVIENVGKSKPRGL